LTIKRRQLVVALLSASFISTSTASAQQASNQTNAARPQSTNQVVGAAESKPAEPAGERPKVVTPANTPPDAKAAPAKPVNAPAFELALVIPSAPNVVKRSATAVEIPVARRVEVPAARRGPAPLEIPLDLFPELKAAPKADAKVVAKVESRKVEPKYESRPVISTAPVLSTAQVGSSFGYRSDPFTGRARFHAGCDIKAHWGESVGASLGGTVQYAGWYHGYGNLVIVNHGGGVTTHYAHLSSFDVQAGQRVERGQIVGRAGATGRATSPHLHYELRVDGNPMNPFQPLALDPASDYFKQQAAAPEKAEVPKPALQLMLVP
jgi:murein DD-endopeptidase MepM/ murein hydrolase activator NlpD